MLVAIFILFVFLIAALIKENQLKKPYINVDHELAEHPEYFEQDAECVHQLRKIEKTLNFCIVGKCFSIIGIGVFLIAYIF